MTEAIYTVSQLNREARILLETQFPSLWVEGEISNFVAPGSGHWYFSLKDSNAQIRCACFKPFNKFIKFLPKDGTQVVVKGRISLYEGRGDFQLIVETLEEAGLGKLQRAFEELKQKLAKMGLFDAAHKKALPAFPKCIGVITSPTGAAIRDILNILKRRFPAVPVIIYPTLVQGETAAPTIVQSIETANKRKECDVLLLARGGGSLEDLWPFNEEMVAYAIHKSAIPLVTGIGHEIDFTIADFVADLRAPTPSAAAELVTPDKTELLNRLKHQRQRLMQLFKQQLQHLKQNLTWITKHLQQQHPKTRLREKAQLLDLMQMEITRCYYLVFNRNQNKLGELAAKLDALSPLATLQRGFSITTKANRVLFNTKEVSLGDKIQVKLHQGQLGCKVVEIEN